ncbi:MAG: hypothetical protein AB7S72_00640 [Draconibacterium sp.]
MTNIQKDTNAKSISEIRIKEPVLIQNMDSRKKTFWDYFTKIGVIIGLFGGILGLIVTGYAINDRWFKDAEIHSKIVSFASSDGSFEVMKIGKPTNPHEMKYGVRFFLKLSLNVIKKDLNYSDVEVLVKFKKIDSIFKGEIYSPRNYSGWSIDSIEYKLELPQESLLYYKSVLKQNTTHLEYITFIVFDQDDKIKNKLKENDLIPEYIQLDFKNSEVSKLRNKTNRLLTNKMSINVGVEKFLWEDEIWIKRTNKNGL